jgi:hypothetical protein
MKPLSVYPGVLSAFILEFWGNNNLHTVIEFAGDCLKRLYPKRNYAKTIVTGVVHLDMLEEFLMLSLEAEGPNVMLFNKTKASASVSTFQIFNLKFLWK